MEHELLARYKGHIRERQCMYCNDTYYVSVKSKYPDDYYVCPICEWQMERHKAAERPRKRKRR